MKLYCSKYIRVCKEINISFMPLEAQVSVYIEELLFSFFFLSRLFFHCLTACVYVVICTLLTESVFFLFSIYKI